MSDRHVVQNDILWHVRVFPKVQLCKESFVFE